MRIAILSRNRKLYSTRRLAAAARKRGHRVLVIDPLDVTMTVSSKRPEAFVKGKAFPTVDAVIPRVGASITFFGTAVVRHLEMMGVYVVNQADAILNSRDKLRAFQILSQHDIGIPPTGFARRPELARSLLSHVDGPPAIVKLLEGTQGAGVIKVDSKSAFNATIDAFHSVGQNLLIQQFLEEAGGADLRVIVVGRRAVAAMRRRAQGDEFRANVHRGGSVESLRPTGAVRTTAVGAARILGLEFAGVDLMETRRGPLVIEVNSSPGLQGVEKASDLDVATALIEHVEAQVARRRARRRRASSRARSAGSAGAAGRRGRS